MFRLISIFILSCFFIGCAAGNCRIQNGGSVNSNSPQPIKTAGPDRLKVYKEDGSLQCGMGKVIPLAEMQKELGSLRVHSSAASKNDGQMRIQVCGAPTGNCHVFEIDRADLAAAQKAGFKEWIYE